MFHAAVSMVLGKMLPLQSLGNAPLGDRLIAVAVWFGAFSGVAALGYALLEVPAPRRMQIILDRFGKPKAVVLARGTSDWREAGSY